MKANKSVFLSFARQENIYFGEENKALNAGFKLPDGSPDMTAYRKTAFELSAYNAGFETKDGFGDVNAYRRSLSFAKKST